MSRVKSDDGAFAIMYVSLIAMVAVLAVLFVDVGALYTEGRQLQNGAQNAATAIASSCAEGDCKVTDFAGGTSATDLPNANDPVAADGRSSATVCGTVSVSSPPTVVANSPSACTPASSQRRLFDCKAPLPSGRYIQVRTRTVDPRNSVIENVLPLFSNLFGGNGSPVEACARAAYGPLGSAVPTFPLAFCASDFNTRTSNGTAFPTTPYFVYSSPAQSNTSDDCIGSPQTYPGGFGWLVPTTTSTSSCALDTSSQWVAGQPGTGSPDALYGACVGALRNALIAASPNPVQILVPIFSGFCKTSSDCAAVPASDGGPVAGSQMLRLLGFGAFDVLGFDFGGGPTQRYGLASNACQHSCIYGYYTRFITYSGSLSTSSTAPNFGGMVVKPIG